MPAPPAAGPCPTVGAAADSTEPDEAPLVSPGRCDGIAVNQFGGETDTCGDPHVGGLVGGIGDARRRPGSPDCRRTVARSTGPGALQCTRRRPDTPCTAGTDPPCLVSRWPTALETADREQTVRQEPAKWKTAELVSEAAQDDTTVRNFWLDVPSGTPGRPGAPGSRSLAWWALLAAFPQDPHVIQWAADTIGSDECLPYSLDLAPDTWALKPAIRNAAQTRLLRETDTAYMTGELAHPVRLATRRTRR